MKLVKRTNGKYYIEYLDNGKQIRLSCKTDNLKKATELLKEYLNGSIKTKEQTKRIANNTVHSLVFQYLKHSEKYYTSKTLSSLKSHLNGLLKVVPKTLDINELDFITLNNLVLNQKSVYQSRLCRSYLSMFFNWIIERGITKDNPISKIKKPKIPQKLPVYINAVDLDLILSEIQKLDNNEIKKMLYDFTLIGFYTGMRLNEITSLQWSQINFNNQTIVLDNQTSQTKSKRIRVIPINNKIQSLLQSRFNQRTGNMVFSHSFSERNFNDLISKNFKRIITKLPELNQSIHFHTLRHSFASNLVNRNINIVTVSKLLGHSDIKTTMVYSHINNSVLVDAINVL